MSSPQQEHDLVRHRTGSSGVFVEVIADLSDHYYQSILAADDNFQPAVSVAKHTLPTDGVALDLGACLGVVASAMAQLAPDGLVIAVEASNDLQAGLVRTCAAAEGAEVRVVHAGVGATTGSIGYHVDAGGGAWGYVGEGGDYEVPQTTIEMLVADHGLERVDFVKLDIEGNELHALVGGEATIGRFRPTLVVELNPYCLWRFGRTLPQDLVTWIDDRYPYLYSVDDHAVVTPRFTAEAIGDMLAEVGAIGSLVDVVASATPLDLPSPLWTAPAAAADVAVVEPVEPAAVAPPDESDPRPAGRAANPRRLVRRLLRR